MMAPGSLPPTNGPLPQRIPHVQKKKGAAAKGCTHLVIIRAALRLDLLLLERDRHVNLNTRLDRDGGDALHDVDGADEVDEALVDAQLEAVPGVGALTVRRLARGDAEDLGREADRPLDGAARARARVREALLERTLDDVRAHCNRGHIPRSYVNIGLRRAAAASPALWTK